MGPHAPWDIAGAEPETDTPLHQFDIWQEGPDFPDLPTPLPLEATLFSSKPDGPKKVKGRFHESKGDRTAPPPDPFTSLMGLLDRFAQRFATPTPPNVEHAHTDTLSTQELLALLARYDSVVQMQQAELAALSTSYHASSAELLTLQTELGQTTARRHSLLDSNEAHSQLLDEFRNDSDTWRR